MKYLVTGGAGFIGSHIVERLLQDGHEVVCLDNFDSFYDPVIKRANLDQAMGHPHFILEEGDIRDQARVLSLFKKHSFSCVVHLAARAGVRPSLLDPILYYDVNTRGTMVLLEAMRATGVRKMVYASSSSVYGNSSKTPFSETDNVDFPISPYAATKKAGELMCHAYHSAFGFDIFCLRFFTVYGPRQRPEMAIHNFTHRIVHGEPISMFGDGSAKRDYTYIEDIVQGLMRSIERVQGYEIINLGESRTTSLRDLVALLASAIGKPAIINQYPTQTGDVAITFADISKAERILDYMPSTPVEEGIVKFITWYGTRR